MTHLLQIASMPYTIVLIITDTSTEPMVHLTAKKEA